MVIVAGGSIVGPLGVFRESRLCQSLNRKFSRKNNRS
jgi:hypothetical protein